LLQVIPDVQPFDVLVDSVGYLDRGEAPLSVDLLRRSAEAYLSDQAEIIRNTGIAVDVESRVGLPAEQIVEAAERDHASLIALATHGYSGLKRWAMGSVTDKVVHASHVPVLVVRNVTQSVKINWGIKRIMVPLDGSELARQALPIASELAAHMHAELLPLMVMVPPVLGDVATVEWYNQAPVILRDRLRKEIEPFAENLRQHEVTVTPVVASGLAASTIAEQAEELNADLIVMASHGASGLRRWAVGSVTDKVLHIASTPVLVVRSQPPE
jgi:nucleotide-binding universal stress UspA family protein